MPLREVPNRDLGELEERYSSALPGSVQLVSAVRLQRQLGLSHFCFYEHEGEGILAAVAGREVSIHCPPDVSPDRLRECLSEWVDWGRPQLFLGIPDHISPVIRRV